MFRIIIILFSIAFFPVYLLARALKRKFEEQAQRRRVRRTDKFEQSRSRRRHLPYWYDGYSSYRRRPYNYGSDSWMMFFPIVLLWFVVIVSILSEHHY